MGPPQPVYNFCKIQHSTGAHFPLVDAKLFRHLRRTRCSLLLASLSNGVFRRCCTGRHLHGPMYIFPSPPAALLLLNVKMRSQLKTSRFSVSAMMHVLVFPCLSVSSGMLGRWKLYWDVWCYQQQINKYRAFQNEANNLNQIVQFWNLNPNTKYIYKIYNWNNIVWNIWHADNTAHYRNVLVMLSMSTVWIGMCIVWFIFYVQSNGISLLVMNILILKGWLCHTKFTRNNLNA